MESMFQIPGNENLFSLFVPDRRINIPKHFSLVNETSPNSVNLA